MGLPRSASKRSTRKHGRGRPALGPLKLPAKRPSWKVVGLAGLAGVAATGVVVARNRRSQAELEPDELRDRLHERLAEIDAAGGNGVAPPAGATPPA